MTEFAEWHVSEIPKAGGARSVCDLGRHAFSSAQQQRTSSGGKMVLMSVRGSAGGSDFGPA